MDVTRRGGVCLSRRRRDGDTALLDCSNGPNLEHTRDWGGQEGAGEGSDEMCRGGDERRIAAARKRKPERVTRDGM